MTRAILIATTILICTPTLQAQDASVAKRLAQYVPVELTTDLDQLTDNERKMIPLLIDAAKLMDACFWYEAYGDKETFLSGLTDNALKAYGTINYGPWDRLNGNQSFVSGLPSLRHQKSAKTLTYHRMIACEEEEFWGN